MDVNSQQDAGQQLVTQLRVLADKANGGDQQALFDLRSLFAEDQTLVTHLGDLAKYTEVTWLDALAGQNALMREAVSQKLADLKLTLAGPEPSTIEKLIVDLVSLNHLVASDASLREAASVRSNGHQIVPSKRAESAQKRLVASLKLLMRLRTCVPAGLQPVERDRVPAVLRQSA